MPFEDVCGVPSRPTGEPGLPRLLVIRIPFGARSGCFGEKLSSVSARKTFAMNTFLYFAEYFSMQPTKHPIFSKKSPVSLTTK